MDIKKSLKDVIVLLVICAVFATVLAAVNSVTAPIIEARLNAAANEAYMAVMPDAKGFENVDLSTYTLPATVQEAKKETSGQGYAIKLETKGYDKGMILIVGVSPDGVVTGATCVTSNETNGVEKSYGSNFTGKDMDGVNAVDLIAGSTLTTTAYRGAIVDAINTATILGGGSVDIRTEEEKFQDALEAALPGGEVFTKVVLLSALDGIDAVYEADNGKGYVCLIGSDSTGTFIGVGADGKAVGDASAEHKALAEAAIESIKANVAVDVDLTPYMDNSLIANYVNSVKKTGAGAYVIEIKTSGNYTANTPVVIEVVIDAEGKIVNARTISHAETENIGGAQLQDGKFNAGFIGKDEAGAGEVDTVAGATVTTGAYKNAVLNAFNVVKILAGESVDTRTEEEKFADALDAALPAGEGEFTKYFKVEIIDGIDAIYIADNGQGFVCLIGSDSTGIFIGVGSDGVAVGEVSAEHKALAEAAIAKITATEFTVLNKADYTGIHKRITSINVTDSGNYVFEIECEGFGKKGNHYYMPSGEYFIIKVSISAEGRILDAQTLYQSETDGIGSVQLEDGAFNAGFIGKNEDECGDVDIVTGVTLTTDAFKKGITRCYAAFEILTGGAN